METLDDYVARHSTPPDDYLYRLYRATHLHLLRPRMASGPVQGQLLRMLMQMVRPRTVVEIGTYSGYSALAMASGMPRGGVVHTFEVNDEQEAFTRPWLEGAPYAAKVEMYVGNVFGARYKGKAEFVGGAILILIGVKILLEHFGVL